MGPVRSNPHDSTFYEDGGAGSRLVVQGEGTMQRQQCPARTGDTHRGGLGLQWTYILQQTFD